MNYFMYSETEVFSPDRTYIYFILLSYLGFVFYKYILILKLIKTKTSINEIAN